MDGFVVLLIPCSSFCRTCCTKLVFTIKSSLFIESINLGTESPPLIPLNYQKVQWIKLPFFTLEERFSPSIQRISVKGTQWIRRRTNLTFIPGKTFPNPLSNVPQTSNEHFLHDFFKILLPFNVNLNCIKFTTKKYFLMLVNPPE